MAAKQWDDDQQGRPDNEETRWCEDVEGPSNPSDDTLEGFIEGAQEIWAEVEHKI